MSDQSSAAALGRANDANTNALSPSRQWATRYRGPVSDPLTVMASPPAISFGIVGAISTISSPQNIATNDARLTYFGNWIPNGDTAFINAERTGGRLSFMLIGSRVDLRVSRSSTSTRGFSVFVDGQIAFKTPFDETVNGFVSKASGGTSTANAARQWMRLDFGTNTLTYKLARVSPGVAGSGYAVGDTIVIAGGTFTQQAVIRITGVNGTGGITNAVVQTPGIYTVLPNNPLQVTSTSGAGTGAQFTNCVFTKVNTIIRARRIDIVFDYGTMFGGIVLDPTSTIAPVPPSVSPKLMIAGDSITEYLNADYAAGTWANITARRLGLDERFVPYGTAGRGWLSSTGFDADTSNNNITDLAGVISNAPDLLVIALGTNDALNAVSLSALTSKVTNNLGSIQTALPQVRTVVVGPIVGDTTGTYSAAIAAGVSNAPDQKRVRFVDFNALGLYTSTSPFASMLGGSQSDIHPNQAGQEMISESLTPRIGAAFQSMLLS